MQALSLAHGGRRGLSQCLHRIILRCILLFVQHPCLHAASLQAIFPLTLAVNQMLISVYKYAAILGVALAMAVGAYFYGDHVGATAGRAALNQTVASLNAKADATLQQAIKAHAAQDAARLQAAQQAQQIAQAAAATAQSTLHVEQNKLRTLYAQPTIKIWANTCVPAPIRSQLRLSPTCGH